MADHSVCSPSKAHRYLNCTPSARLEEAYEVEHGAQVSSYALEGTNAHALAEWRLNTFFHPRDAPTVKPESDEAMDTYIDEYLEYVVERLQETDTVSIETKLDLTKWIPECHGTADCVLINEVELAIIDLKYGSGVKVSAVYNEQLMVYALGAIGLYSKTLKPEKISLCIFQPRLMHTDEWSISRTDLLRWGHETLIPKAAQAFDGDGEQVVGEWCRFCKCRAVCRKRAEYALELAIDDFKAPPIMTDDEIDTILPRLAGIKCWCESLESYALGKALTGYNWSGFKLIESMTRRSFCNDEQSLVKALTDTGLEDPYKRVLMSVAEVEKALKASGKKANQIEALLDKFIVRGRGKPKLVTSNTHGKEWMYTAEHDFTKYTDEGEETNE